MNISIINGSPKPGKSTTELMIEYLIPFISENTVSIHNINRANWDKIQFAEIGGGLWRAYFCISTLCGQHPLSYAKVPYWIRKAKTVI